ncbi:MAG: hypothetical protein ACMUIE_08940 [Thermoplasmatota archaeon]
MREYRGSCKNLPPLHRTGVVILAFVLPAVIGILFLISLTHVSWWGFLLVLFLLSLLISISVLATFKGHRISIDGASIQYKKGFAKGRIPLKDITIAYRVKAADRISILIIFHDRPSPTSPYRCLALEQTFSEADMEAIFSELRRHSGRNRFKTYSEATLTQIRNDKEILKWTPV